MKRLIGKFFHSDGAGGWQGQILRRHKPRGYLVQLFSWADGSPSETVVVHADRVAKFTLYDSDIEMRAASEAHNRKLMEQLPARQREETAEPQHKSDAS